MGLIFSVSAVRCVETTVCTFWKIMVRKILLSTRKICALIMNEYESADDAYWLKWTGVLFENCRYFCDVFNSHIWNKGNLMETYRTSDQLNLLYFLHWIWTDVNCGAKQIEKSFCNFFSFFFFVLVLVLGKYCRVLPVQFYLWNFSRFSKEESNDNAGKTHVLA